VGVTLVVVHYRTREPLQRLLASIRETRPAPLREIVIVNNSGEPLEDLATAGGLPTRILVPGSNWGYARGVNHGIRAATEEDVLVLNPDVVVTPGSVEALVRCAERHPRAGIVAPRLHNPDGTLQLSARRFYNATTLLLRRLPFGRLVERSRAVREHTMAAWDHEETRPVDWVVGAALLARRRAMRDVGLMDERYFLYFEDVDWCQRMWRHGFEVIYCAEARMVHEHQRASARLEPRSWRAHLAGLLRFTEKWSALLYAVSQYRRRVLQAAALAGDVVAVAAAFLAAYGIRLLLDPWFGKPIFPLPSYGGLLVFAVAMTISALAWNGLYRRLTFEDEIDRAFQLGRAVLQAGLLLMAATFFFQTPRFSRFLVLLLGPLCLGMLYVLRAGIERLGAGARRHGFTFRRVLLLGSGDAASRARAVLEAARGEGFEPLRAELRGPDGESPEDAASRLHALVSGERVQVVLLVPEEGEIPHLLAVGLALRESGAAVYWAGPASRLAPLGAGARLGPLDATLLYAPSRGLGLRARKRASDLFLSFVVAPWRWRGLRAYLSAQGVPLRPEEAWKLVWSGERSWVGRSGYEADRWAGIPAWARLALQTLRPGVVSPAPPPGAGTDRSARLESELAYLTRFSMAEDLRLFLRATQEGSSRARG
jgi:N-acetylglucosaminyl-diphospho-decaprenol L-rhamnosyltransferase